MEKRKLGNSELYINPVGLGCMGFSHASGDPTEKSVAVRTLREAYEIGYDFFDTAESYTGVNPDRTICRPFSFLRHYAGTAAFRSKTERRSL